MTKILFSFCGSLFNSEGERQGALGGSCPLQVLDQGKQVRFQQTLSQGFVSAVLNGVLEPTRLARHT